MKKILALILTVVTLFGVMAMSVSAESPEAVVCNPGDTIVITFSLSEEYQQIKSGSVEYEYNEEVFEFVSADWTFKNTLIKNVDTEKKNGVFAFSSAKTVSGEAFTLKLKVKAEAAYGEYNAIASFQLKNAENVNADVSVTANLSVVEYVEIDDPTTPADFSAAASAIGNDASEANFDAIKNALDTYSKLTAAEKAAAQADYEQLLSKINDYNSAAADANVKVETVTYTAFSVVVDIFAYVSELIEAIIGYIFN